MLLVELPHWLVHGTAIALGLCFGSFLNVVIHRLPRDLNLAYPPSTCPHCNAPIAARDNVPLLGWMLLRGKARCCGAPINARYPIIEALGGLLAWALVVARIHPLADQIDVGHAALLFATYLALGLGLIALAFIDLEFMILPDSLTLGGTALGLASTFYRDDLSLTESAIGAGAGFVGIWLPFIWAYQKLRGFPGMGLGDAKLIMLSGAWFGTWGAVFALFAGALQGTVAALVIYAVQGKLTEPAQVTAEREELKRAIEEAEGEERIELERILRDDPLGDDPATGLSGARMAFGPFLSLACLELLLFQTAFRNFLLTRDFLL